MDGAANVEVTNPKHYAHAENVIEAIDGIRSLGFNLGSARKYISRLGLKGGENTVNRDAGATIWYCLDLLHWLMEVDDEKYRPSVTYYAELDTFENFYNSKDVVISLVEESFDLKFAEEPAKRFVLGLINNIMTVRETYDGVGCSDSDWTDHIHEVMLCCVITISLADAYKSSSTESFVDRVLPIYKGSRSFIPNESTKEAVAAMLKLAELKGYVFKRDAI